MRNVLKDTRNVLKEMGRNGVCLWNIFQYELYSNSNSHLRCYYINKKNLISLILNIVLWYDINEIAIN